MKKGDRVKPCRAIGDKGKPKGITVHNTAMIKVQDGTNPAEQYARATYPNLNMGGAVVHFFVYKKEIWQLLREDEQGWHATDGQSRRSSHRMGEKIGGNLDTIAIECIGEDRESEDSTAALCAYLCRKYGLVPETDIYSHSFFYSKKKCPVYILPHWDGFIKTVKEYYMDKSKDYENHWAKKYIAECMNKGLMNGYGDGSFRPDQSVTRAELAVVLCKITDNKENR